MSEYITNKARRYITLGHAAYAAEDAFKFPKADWGREVLTGVSHAMQQFAFGRGFSRGMPLRGISFRHFLSVADTLHFRLDVETYKNGVDTLYLQHVVDGSRKAVVYLAAEDIDTGLDAQDFLAGFVVPDVPVPEGFAGTLLYIESQPCPDPCLRNAIHVIFQPINERILRRALSGAEIHELVYDAERLTPQVPVDHCPKCGSAGWETCSALLANHSYRVDLGGKADDEYGEIVAAWVMGRGMPEAKRLR